ncbi:MAG TPA: hypothetical protein VEP90_05645, partial [Methylomirabilota bacterium]|nr:hypothetical protein [Methylomirabilota bacterium]
MALVVDNDVNVGSGLTAGISTCTLGSGGGATTMNITKGSIVIALVGCNRTPAQGSFAKVISITGGGLTFVRRKQLQVHHLGGAGGERYSDTEIWWAYASSNQTNVALIATTDLVTDGTTFIAFGVTGFQGTYYQTHPWDDDVSVPAVKNCTIQDPPVSEVPSIIFNANGGILPSP